MSTSKTLIGTRPTPRRHICKFPLNLKFSWKYFSGGQLGVMGAILGQTIGGLIFSLLAGQPLIIIMTTAPIALYIKVPIRSLCRFISVLYLWSKIAMSYFSILQTICLDIDRKSQREPEREPEWARENQGEPERARENLCGSLWLSGWSSLSPALSRTLSLFLALCEACIFV